MGKLTIIPCFANNTILICDFTSLMVKWIGLLMFWARRGGIPFGRNATAAVYLLYLFLHRQGA